MILGVCFQIPVNFILLVVNNLYPFVLDSILVLVHHVAFLCTLMTSLSLSTILWGNSVAVYRYYILKNKNRTMSALGLPREVSS